MHANTLSNGCLVNWNPNRNDRAFRAPSERRDSCAAWSGHGGERGDLIVSWTWTRGRDLHTDDLLAACGCAVDYYCYKVLAWYASANVVPQRAGLVERPTCRRGEPDKCHITIVYHLDVWEPLFSLNCNAMSPVGRVRIRLKFCSGDT